MPTVDLENLVAGGLAEIAGVGQIDALEEVRVRLLGKKGTITAQLKQLGALPAAERPAAGARINEAKERRAAPSSSRAPWHASSPPARSTSRCRGVASVRAPCIP
jgi:phenylalanyl-tRNA synthetase alpha subunit